MAEIQELPIEPEPVQEIQEPADESATMETLEPSETHMGETHIGDVALEPPEPAPKPKARSKAPKPEPAPKAANAKPKGRPKGSKTKPPPRPQEPEPEMPMPSYVQEHVEQYAPPQDLATSIMNMLQTRERDRRAYRVQKYANWVGRF